MYKLFIVDDEQTVIEGLSECIDWNEHNISICGTATDGGTAFEKICALLPDIVITDIRMPVMNGLELIEKANEAGIKTKFILFSGYSEFEYAKRALQAHAVNYLIKPVSASDLVNAIVQAILEVEQGNHYNDLQRVTSLQKEKLEQKKLLDCILLNDTFTGDPNQKYMIAALGIKPNTGAENSLDKLVDHSGSTPGLKWYFVKLINNYFLIAETINEDHINESEAISIIGEQLALSQPDLYGIITVGYSMNHPGRLLNQCYKEAADALGYAVYLSLPEASFSDISYNDSNSDFQQILGTMDACLKKYDLDKLFEHLDELFEQFKKLRLLPDTLKKFCFDAFFHATSIMENEYKIQVNTIFASGFNPVLEINALVSINDTQVYLHNFYRTVFQYISNHVIGFKTKIIKMIKKYISEKLSEPVTLDDLADYMNKSKGYISSIFRQETGLTLPQYITDCRIKRAKELLIEDRYKVSEIAHMVGFIEERYFCMVFKKETGLTAGNYRRIYLLDRKTE